MMLRTLAAFGLGTLAASTAVASHALTEGRSVGRTVATPASTPTSEPSATAAPTLSESILSLRDVDPRTGDPRGWNPVAQRLIDEGVLEELAAGAEKMEAAFRNREAGIEQGRHEVLRPAIEIPKTPSDSIVVPYNLDGTPASTGRIHLKYRDGLGARASISGTTPVLSVVGRPLGGLNEVLEAEGAVVRQLIKHPENVIESVRRKAMQRSGRVQPDLAAMMVVELPGPVDWDRVIRVARSINDIPEIEWVSLEPTVSTAQDCGESPTGNTFCNLPRNTGPKTLYEQRLACEQSLVFDPFQLTVPPTVDGTDCDPAVWLQQVSADLGAYWDPAWGAFDATNYFFVFEPQNAAGSWAGDVTVPGAVNGQANWAANYPIAALGVDPNVCSNENFIRTGCEDIACCDIVAAFLPECADADSTNGWDAFCAAAANILCEGSIYDNVNPNTPMPERYDPCLSTYRPTGADGAPGAPANEIFYEVSEDCPAPPMGPGMGVIQPAQIAVQPPDGFWTEDPALAQRLPVFQFSAGFLGNCFEPQITAGCNIPACCASICVTDPACCNSAWDVNCVTLATASDVCTEATPEPTPDYSTFSESDGFTTGVQAFLTSSFYQFLTPQPVDPTDIGTAFRGSGFTGGGLDLDGAAATVGLIWRLYGQGSIDARRCPDVPPSDDPLPIPSLRRPNHVWLGGAEWIVHVNETDPESDWVRVSATDPAGPDNPFPAFAIDGSCVYDDMWLEPTGRKEQVAVCEFSAFPNHEEWCFDAPRDENSDLNPPSSINVEAGQTLDFLDTSNAYHGTACLGVTTAPNNGFGVNGIAPYAEPWFFPIQSVEEGFRATTAMISMIQDLEPGAVINHSWGPTAPGACLTSVQAYYTAIRVSTDAGLVVCLSAGNDGCSLIPEPGEEPSGGIIVGALEPGLQVPLVGGCLTPRRINFSTHSGDELAVQACAWGICGGTTGYGDLFRGEDARAPFLPVGEAPYVRTYTGPNFNNAQGGFSGTSFAGPQIAGCSALAQGAVRMFWETTINGDFMGGLVANQDSPAGPYNCQNLGYPDECPIAQNGDGCNGICGDIFPPDGDPPGTLSNVGNFCNLSSAISGALTIIEDPTAGTLELYSGTLLRGNSISLTAVDGLIYAVRSEPRVQGPGPEGLVYFASGETIDFGATVQVGIPPEDVVNMALTTVSGASSYAAELPFVWNRSTERWQLTGISVLQFGRTPHVYNVGGFDTGQAPSVFVDENNAIRVRFYTVGLGFINGGFVGSWDQAAIIVNGELNPL